jgi:predicted XRE-type DNA-binding protein
MLITQLGLAQSAINEVQNCLKCRHNDLYEGMHTCIKKYTEKCDVMITPTKFQLKSRGLSQSEINNTLKQKSISQKSAKYNLVKSAVKEN